MRIAKGRQTAFPPLAVIAWCRFLLPLAGVTALSAHPMGNFSINHYAKLTIADGSVEVLYILDMAEIPAFQETRQSAVGPAASAADRERYLDGKWRELKDGLSLENDGKTIPLEVISRRLDFAPGAGGLSTMKLAFVLRGRTQRAAGTHTLAWRDTNFPDRAGWKEVVVRGDGVAIAESSAASEDRSQELTDYSSDPLSSPPQQASAEVTFRIVPSAAPVRAAATPPQPAAPAQAETPVEPAAPVAHSPSAAHSPSTPRSRFTELISTQANLSLWMLLSAALIAAALGALHALEPGHGKTVVAAYLVGSRGTAKHAVLLGMVVTAAHTAGVFLLGGATLYASRYIVPEQLYPWLGAISGITVAGLGTLLFLRNLTGKEAGHSHGTGAGHASRLFSKFTGAASPAALPADGRALSIRGLCALGITGGMVPCPAALVVLLSAISLHRIRFGLFLITSFSFGLAAVLVIVGLTMVWAKRSMAARFSGDNTLLRWLPYVSAACIMALGAGIAISAVAPLQLWPAALLKDRLVPLATVVALGLLLGIRHSTDPDHVVAVSTIVTRQKSIRGSAAIGLLWGLGHTLTIFAVGSAIILFGLAIPPRLGLFMEFCVALMLILLGGLNLSGFSAQIPDRASGTIGRTALDMKPRWLPESLAGLGLYQTLRPVAVGLVHGLAGSAAVALLVLSTIRSPLWSTLYLLIFGFGTMTGMMLMTATISIPMVHAGNRSSRISRSLVFASGIASVAFGFFLVYQIGFVDGLFTRQVRWTPQ